MQARTVAVYTADNFLFTKILLSAPDGVSVVRGESDADELLILVDTDTVNTDFAALRDAQKKVVTMSRTDDDTDLKIPFSLDTVAKLLNNCGKDQPILRLAPEGKRVYLYGKPIRLTEVESALLALLIERGGEYATREQILREVWGDDADSGVINVYVHYLREKLEAHGEKIILSSRKRGYKIDERYLGEVKENA
ncbi:MAG: winged helix-turn-helix transcriptional regulator [Clostridia bacterium]|nr:winged helix-turn-helix transcriptional regulator [Clostridia bacterium]